MIIRPATDEDLPQMLELARQSLGELSGLRTEDYWQWKHTQNPFGQSLVLLAFDEEKLVGLRAFMQWRFRYRGKTFQAYRAVDTATHPAHQGKGIFSTLTLAMVDQVKQHEPAIIFNTPNGKSMPGYLKMGWKMLGKTRLRVRIHPVNMLRHRMMKTPHVEPAPIVFPEDMASVLTAWQNAHTQEVMTNDHLPYLMWRYQHIPMLRYGLHVTRVGNSTAMIIYRLKSSNVRELRLVELFYVGPERKKVVQRAIRELEHQVQPDVTTVLADASGQLDALLPLGFFKADSKGLTITGREVNDKPLDQLLSDFNAWSFSAGALELF